MSSRSKLEAKLKEKLPPKAREAAGRARRMGHGVSVRARRSVRRGLVPGLLSVVVPCYNVEAYLDECLVSLRFQHYRDIEIIVVDDGSPDRSHEIARAHQKRDLRIRVVRRENGGLGAARNTGVEHARGEFLTFIDSDDVVSPEVFSAPIAALRDSGSDLAVTHYDRLEKDGRHTPAGPWIRSAHRQRRLATTLEEFPEAMVNAVAWSKVYRREFWDACGLAFPVGKLYEDQAVSMEAFARARTFDVLPEIGVHWRIRGDKSSISQSSGSVRNLADHNDAVRASLEVLRRYAGETTAQQRVLQLLANNMPFFTRHLLAVGDDYWALLRTAIADLTHGLDRDVYVREVNAQDKVLYELIIAGRREDADAFVEQWGTDLQRHPTRPDPGSAAAGTPRMLVDLPLAHDLPADATVLADSQLMLEHRVMNTHWTAEGGLRLTGWAFIRYIDLADNPPVVTVSLLGEDGTGIPLDVESFSEVRLEQVDGLLGHWHNDYRNGGWTAHLPADRLPTAGRWQIELTMTAAGISRTVLLEQVSHAGSAAVTNSTRDEEGRLLTLDRPLRHGHRRLELRVEQADSRATPAPQDPVDGHPVATDWELTDDAFTIEVTGAPAQSRPVLDSGVVKVTGTVTAIDDTRTRITFPLTHSVWGRDGLALRTGKYGVRLEDGAGASHPVVPAADVLAHLPAAAVLARHRAYVEVITPKPLTLALRLDIPLPDDAVGRRNQYRLRTAHRSETADQDAVFFRSLFGEVTNCNMLAVHEELGARGADLVRYWSVRDHSVPVPEGGVPVIEGTPEWHEAIVRSRYHMINVHQMEWFEKPAGQIMIQTKHGYPYKVMGHQWWEKGSFDGAQVASFDRRARDWDYFVSPATYATPLLRKAFLDPAGATPEILEIGYPRNDVLLSDRAEGIRKRTREVLGVRPDQTVVMYAPTFRDYLSADDIAAARVDFFDAQRAAAALGENVVLLVRGHAFNARTEQARLTGHQRIIDVTDHPDVNDLILASDAAILDYSSLRFDYAITKKPMIFLVPDLERYDANRGGVIPYGPTAPGPHVDTTDQVVDLLRDLSGLRKTYASDIDRFLHDYVDLEDGHASARLVDAVFVPRGDAPPRR